MNFPKFLRTPFSQNTSGRLLLNVGELSFIVVSADDNDVAGAKQRGRPLIIVVK